jgi:hypothetical protein
MEHVGARVAVWVFTAFWFWLVLARIFSRLRVPYAAIIAAVLGWIGAGLFAAWVLPPADI